MVDGDGKGREEVQNKWDPAKMAAKERLIGVDWSSIGSFTARSGIDPVVYKSGCGRCVIALLTASSDAWASCNDSSRMTASILATVPLASESFEYHYKVRTVP